MKYYVVHCSRKFDLFFSDSLDGFNFSLEIKYAHYFLLREFAENKAKELTEKYNIDFHVLEVKDND